MKPGMKTIPAGRPPLRNSAFGAFAPGRSRGSRRYRLSNLIKTVVPLGLLAIVYFSRPDLSQHAHDGDGFFGRQDTDFMGTTPRLGGVLGAGIDEGAHSLGAAGDRNFINDPGDVALRAEFANGNLPDLDTALEDLAQCEDFYCIKRAHYAIGGRTHFNFPHFFLIGWQKCATTSVNLHLRAHPEYLPSPVKESHYFTTCQHFWNHTSCMAHNTSHYISEFFRINDAVESRLEKVAVDASVDYAWKGTLLAPELHRLFPWIKLVIIMREPLSRLISYVRMYTQRGHEVKGCLGDRNMYDCLQYHLDPMEANSNYSVPLEAWFEYFPPEQFHVIQFEELQEDPNAVVRRLKEFLGMDPELPKRQLKNTNLRKSGGYNMTKEDYQGLLEQVRWDAERVASMLSSRGLADKVTWLSRWEKVWDENLETCDETGMCLVNSN